MPKSRTRRPARRRPPTPTLRHPSVDLVRGVAGPGGIRIRLARRYDAEAVYRLLPLAEPSLDEDGRLMLEHPKLATGLQRALRQGSSALFPASADRTQAYDLFLSVSLLLVAVNEQNTVIGVLMALPPVRILGRARQAGVPLADVLVAARTVVKIKAVAVAPDARGAGVGSALINHCAALYTELGWRLIYGQINDDGILDGYYTQLGFTVLDRSRGIDLADLLSFPCSIHPMLGERLFLRRVPDAPGRGERMPVPGG